MSRLIIVVLRHAIVATALLVPMSVYPVEQEPRHKQLIEHFDKVITKRSGSLETKLDLLLSVASTDVERAWLIYRWITYHFKHDSGLASRIGDPSQHSLEKLHQLGGGSCAVYANVTHRLMQMAGLEVRTIYGLVKGGPPTSRFDGKPVNHVWNAVKIDGVWKLVDATWGAGVVGRQGFQPEHSDLFFLLAPEKAVLSHYDGADELGYQKEFAVDRSLFSRLPDDALYAAAAGFDLRLILDSTRKNSRFELVSVFDLPPGTFRILSAPVYGSLDRKSQRFLIESAVFEELMLVQGRTWQPFKKSGSVHSVTLVPNRGELIVMGRRPKQSEFEALLGYLVK